MIITLKHGLSTYAPNAFIQFGSLLCVYLEEKNDLCKYKDMALELLNGSTDKRQVIQVYFTIYSCMSYWFEHVSLSVEPLRDVYTMARESGVNNLAFHAVCGYFYRSFLIGTELSDLSEEMEEVHKEVLSKYIGFSSFYTLVRIFLGILPIDAILAIDSTLAPTKKQEFLHSFYCITVAYYFHEYDSAADLIEKWRVPSKEFYFGSILYQNFVFYYGLVALSMVKRKVKSSYWLQIANESVSLLRLWSNIVAENFQHRLTLLEAEMASAIGNENDAMKLFEQAICLSQKYCYINEEALANERALLFSLKINAIGSAKRFFKEAMELYQKWGAMGKVRQIKSLYSSHFDENDTSPEIIEIDDDSISSISKKLSIISL